MSSSNRWVWSVLVVGILAAVAWRLAVADDRTLAVVSAVVGVIALSVPATAWLWRSRKRDWTDTAHLTAAADTLAVAVHAQWEVAAAERKLRHPAPVPVWWRWTDRPVAGPVNDPVGETARAARMTPLPGMRRVRPQDLRRGEVRDLFAIYAGLDSGRMLLLGAPGSGKSGAAVLLVLDALNHRAGLPADARALVPVPVLLTTYGWNPQIQPVTEWLTRRLAEQYPFLRSGPSGRHTPERLVKSGKVALVLDGLDEMPPSARRYAVRALAEQCTFRLVVLTRSRELVDATTDGPLIGAAALELQPVHHADAADYLTRCQTVPIPGPWAKLVACIRTDHGSPVSEALTTPLMLTLVRDTLPRPADIDAVLLAGDFAGRGDVEDMLLDRVLAAAYTPRPGQAPPPCTVEQAQCWLGYIAAQMNQADTRDLAWWEMHRWQPTGLRIVATILVAGFAVGLGTGLGTGLVAGLGGGLVAGLAVTLVSGPGLGALAGFGVGGGRPQLMEGVRLKQLLTRANLVPGLTAGLALVPFIAFIFGVPAGLLFGLAAGIVAGLVSTVVVCLVTAVSVAVLVPASENNDPLDPLTCWRRDQQSGIFFGIWVGLLFGSVMGSALWLVGGPVIGLGSGLAIGLGAVVACGLTYPAAWPARLTFLQLWRSGHAPLRIVRFLEDARTRDVLRTSGPVYQFRHARLQDRLATTHTRPVSPRTSNLTGSLGFGRRWPMRRTPTSSH